MSVAAVMMSAAVAGLLGSLHCAGMCGPLVVSGCSRESGQGGAAGYFAGRLIAYSTLGAIVGHLGKHAFCLLPMSTAQVLAVGLTALPAAARGLSLLLSARPPKGLVELRKKPAKSWLSVLASVLPRHGLGLGLATGILPCGLLITAFAMAAATASPVLGAASMAAFSIGSLPGPLAVLLGRGLAGRLNLRLSPRAEGVLWCLLAVWLGVRLAMGESCHTGLMGA